MINLTSQYPNQVFLPVAVTQLTNQVNAINASGIPNRQFPKKYGRGNIGFAPNGSGAATTQIDVLINGNTPIGFLNLKDAQSYAQQAANQTINNACYYIENIQPSYYQLVCWGTV